MADAAFKTAPFSSMTTGALRYAQQVEQDADKRASMNAEILRRDAVALGDISQMTAGERLRFHQTGKAR